MWTEFGLQWAEHKTKIPRRLVVEFLFFSTQEIYRSFGRSAGFLSFQCAAKKDRFDPSGTHGSCLSDFGTRREFLSCPSSLEWVEQRPKFSRHPLLSDTWFPWVRQTLAIFVNFQNLSRGEVWKSKENERFLSKFTFFHTLINPTMLCRLRIKVHQESLLLINLYRGPL